MTCLRVGRATGKNELLLFELVNKLLMVSSDEGDVRHGDLGELRCDGSPYIMDECLYTTLKNDALISTGSNISYMNVLRRQPRSGTIRHDSWKDGDQICAFGPRSTDRFA